MAEVSPGVFFEKLSEDNQNLLSGFACGHKDTDEYINEGIYVYEKENLGKTYLLL